MCNHSHPVRTIATAAGAVIDLANGSAYSQGRRIPLTPREWALLRLLVEQAGATVKREAIEERLFCWGRELGSNAIDVHVHALRRKFWPGLIETERGVGFRLNLDARPAAERAVSPSLAACDGATQAGAGLPPLRKRPAP